VIEVHAQPVPPGYSPEDAWMECELLGALRPITLRDRIAVQTGMGLRWTCVRVDRDSGDWEVLAMGDDESP
jgi:hypothetical protein